MVDTISGQAAVLSDGVSFPLMDATRVTRIAAGTLADLQPGRSVSISARSGPDGVLEASLIGLFAEGVTPNEGQRPLAETLFCQPGCGPADLMTNAAIIDAQIDAVTGGELRITFAGQPGVVVLTPDTRVELQSVGSIDDVAPGSNVLGFLNDEGTAASVWVYVD
jgi:hypothetical protein